MTMRTTETMPVEVRLALLRDAMAILDPRRNPGTRAEAAAVLCETLLAEGARAKARGMFAEAAIVAGDTIANGPLPAEPRMALVSALQEAVTRLAGEEAGSRRARPQQPRGRRGALSA
jgi:hypothetical protein